MKGFNEFIVQKKQEEQIKESIVMLAICSDFDINSLNESNITEAFNDKLGKFGLKLHTSTGIAEYIAKFSSASGKLIMAAIKGDKAKVKEIASKLDKGEVIDFLLKLDTLTAHLVTGPIHIIDAITGWDLMANIKAKAEVGKKVYDSIVKMVQEIKQKAYTAFANEPKILKAIENLEKTIANPS